MSVAYPVRRLLTSLKSRKSAMSGIVRATARVAQGWRETDSYCGIPPILSARALGNFDELIPGEPECPGSGLCRLGRQGIIRAAIQVLDRDLVVRDLKRSDFDAVAQ